MHLNVKMSAFYSDVLFMGFLLMIMTFGNQVTQNQV